MTDKVLKCNKCQKMLSCEMLDTMDITKSYINQYKNDLDMIQVGDDIESDDEHSIMTVRSGDKWCKIKVKK